MLESFVTALSDREGEFVRLDEIRDALAKHFGTDGDAKSALGFSSGTGAGSVSLRTMRP